MNNIINLLREDSRITGYKINIHQKQTYELFFVKGKLETLRCSDTCDKLVTVYAAHGDYLGDAQFYVYPSTTDAQLKALIADAVSQALLIRSQPYELPAGESGDYQVDSNLADFDPAELAAQITGTIWDANRVEHATINSLEVFLTRHTETVLNSRGLRKTQVRHDAMVEAIPTYNGENQSVELYELIHFGNLDQDALVREIAGQMEAVKARCHDVTPDFPMDCSVILNTNELSELFINIPWDLHYGAVYSQSNLFKKGDAIQSNPRGDKLGITMAGAAGGSVRSARFDADGLSLGSIRLVEDGKVLNYYGSNRYGQYLEETPTGELRCMILDPGSLEEADFHAGPCLDVISMSGLQVDFYSDYIGGEIRLAYYRDGETCIPVTGISVSGKLSDVLNSLRLSKKTTVYGGYIGPEKALLSNMTIF